jgi:hypothetical protein
MKTENKKDLWGILGVFVCFLVADGLIIGCHEWGSFSGSIFIAALALCSGLLLYLFVLLLSFIPFLQRIRDRLDHANSLTAAMTIIGVVVVFIIFYHQESAQLTQQSKQNNYQSDLLTVESSTLAEETNLANSQANDAKTTLTLQQENEVAYIDAARQDIAIDTSTAAYVLNNMVEWQNTGDFPVSSFTYTNLERLTNDIYLTANLRANIIYTIAVMQLNNSLLTNLANPNDDRAVTIAKLASSTEALQIGLNNLAGEL